MSYLKFQGKKLLVLGATAQTVPMVETANDMGVITYVADHISGSLAKRSASVAVDIDCFDVDSLEQVVRKERIDGIIVGCADRLLLPYYELCRRVQKPCYVAKDILDVFNNKKGLKTALKKYGLPVIPEWNYVGEQTKTEDWELPVFIKPADNNSAKGMSVCYQRKEISAAIEKAMDTSASKTILVERYMNCDDITVNYMFFNGFPIVFYITDRYVDRGQAGCGTIPTALIYHSKYKQLYFDTMHDKMCRMFTDLGLKNGILLLQGFVQNGQIMFYDPALRITGEQGHIFIKHATSVDQIAILISYALTGKMGEKIKVPQGDVLYCGWGCELVINAGLGRIGKINGLREVERLPEVLRVTQIHFPGDEIVMRGTLDQTIARIHVMAESKDGMKDSAERILSMISVVDESGNNMLLGQVNLKEI